MSTKQDRDQLKTYFETGDRPTQKQFEELIDSVINQESDLLYVTPTRDVGIGTTTPLRKLHVTGKTFVSTDVNKTPNTGNALEVFAGTSHGIAINTEGNDVFNFLDTGGSNSNPFTITDNAGRGFRFYNDSGTGVTGEQLRIAKNGNITVGSMSQDAQSKLHVLGQSGDETSNGMLRLEVQGSVANTMNLRLGVQSGDYAWIQSTGKKPLHINRDGKSNTLLNQLSGNVGIGIAAPSNKLHLHNGTNPNTGLQLSTGAQGGHVLVSDGSGNASWQSPTVVTSGLWQANGNNIHNGNSGEVYIGNNSTLSGQQLTVNGNTIIKSQLGEIELSNTNNGASVSLVQRRTQYLNLGNIRYDQIWGNGSLGEVGAFMHTYKGNGSMYVGMGSKSTDLYFGAGVGKTLRIVTDNDGGKIGAELTNNKDWYFFSNNLYLGASWDTNGDRNGLRYDNTLKGPQLFGDQRGVLATKNTLGIKPALEWRDDQSVDLKGEVTVNGNKPILLQRFKFRDIFILQSPGELSGGISLDKSSADYGAAFVVGWAFEGGNVTGQRLDLKVFTVIRNGTWHVVADLSNINTSNRERWNVDVVFVRTELSARIGDFANNLL